MSTGLNHNFLDQVGIPDMPDRKLEQLMQRFQNYPETYREIYLQLSEQCSMQPASDACSLFAIEQANPANREPIPGVIPSAYVYRLVLDEGWISGIERSYDQEDVWEPLPFLGPYLRIWLEILSGEQPTDEPGFAEWGALAAAHQIAIMFKIEVALTVLQVFGKRERGRPSQG